ncbi:MAG: hypothetical protein KVP17_002384 [Porospora cf. gigantea B]|uniref:uncharacterized protein n=1 Tax=Porospora cf. gigantea B TaxID=2853592 RepID=UPI003571FB2D|nr:MAG: hypothetical protein KVP17_002384 [Porospora cf. gigantea B]
MKPRPDGTSRPPPQFFVDTQRGEVNELKQTLQRLAAKSDPDKLRETMKRVVVCMTVGMDVSKVFTEVVLACATTDIVTKKMIYLVITTHAEVHPELSLLTVNTLTKDSQDVCPSIRGLALRSLSSLKLPMIREYLEPSLKQGLRDASPIVRKAACMGCVKLHALISGLPGDFQELLTERTYDRNVQVGVAALQALNEVSGGQFVMPRSMAHHFVRNISQAECWQQCVILDFLANYVPEDSQEPWDIMNALEDNMQTNSPAVVVATSKAFLCLAGEDKLQQIIERMRSPFLGLSVTSSDEEAYCILLHLRYLLIRGGEEAARSFADDFQTFYLRHSDSSSLKRVKLDILPLIVTEKSGTDLTRELYDSAIAEKRPEVQRMIVAALGHVATQAPSCQDAVWSRLSDLLDSGIPTLATEALQVLCTAALSRMSLISLVVNSSFARGAIGKVTCEKALVAFLTLLGSHPAEFASAPYWVESAIELYCDRVDVWHSTPVTLALLGATTKIFLVRAPEMQPGLGLLLEEILNGENTPFPVRDRALYLHRFLETSTNTLRNLLFINDSSTPAPPSCKVPLFEYNSLSVVFDKPISEFMTTTPLSLAGRRNLALAVGKPLPLKTAEPLEQKDAKDAEAVSLL